MNNEEKNRWKMIKPIVSADEKIEDLKEKLRKEPENTEYIRELAFLLFKQQRYSEFLEHFKKIIDLGKKELEMEILEFVIVSLKIKKMEEIKSLNTLEDNFGVTAVVPTVAKPEGAQAASKTAPQSEEKTEFDVVLVGFDAVKKISVIKAIREVMQLGLKESKDLVEASEKEVQKIKESLPKKDAEELRKKLEKAGAKVELK